MKRLFLLLPLLLSTTISGAQTWDQVKRDTQTYLTGEGWGETLDEADKQALSDLVSKITINISSDFEMLEGETQRGATSEYQSYVKSKINTYSNGALTNTEKAIISNEPDAHVVRWIKRSEIELIFQGRKNKIYEFVSNAVKSESKGKIDDALRNYYWAYSMLKTLQHPSTLKFNYDGEDHVMVSWIPQRMNDIFSDIKPSIISRNGDDLELYFSFRNMPVASLDYTYFDGSSWSNIYSAKDGHGVLELAPGAIGQNIQIKYEYAYKNEAHIDKELYDVINVVKGNSMRASYVMLKGDVDFDLARAVSAEDKSSLYKATKSLTKTTDDSHIKSSVEVLVEAIRNKQYSLVSNLFTPDGFDMYLHLISYGKAAIVGNPVYAIYKYENKTVVRSIRMSFSFARGVRKSFVEDIVLTFNPNGLIESLAFALDDKAAQDILGKQVWPESARMAIIEFLENYKTAFALKRLDYISTIFDDNAVIIVGKVASITTPTSTDNNTIYLNNNEKIIRTRYDKNQYLKHLERCFESNEFVNIRFANNDVVKAGKGGEIYGIQIKQDYYSTNYGDSGYLFLLVDINDPDKPTIRVRTWQPQPDPQDGIFDLSHF